MQIRESSYDPIIAGLIEAGQPRTTKKGGQNIPDTQDTVSISAEAFTLAQLVMENRIKEAELFSGEEDNSDNPSAQQDATDNKTASSKALREEYSSFLYTPDGRKRTDADGSSGSSPAEQIEKIEKEIKKLQGQLKDIYASDSPDGVKDQKGEAIHERIQVLTEELHTLKNPSSTPSSPAQKFAALV